MAATVTDVDAERAERIGGCAAVDLRYRGLRCREVLADTEFGEELGRPEFSLGESDWSNGLRRSYA